MKDIINNPKTLNNMAQDFRINILDMVKDSKEGHLGACFSCIEILTSLYFNIMNIDPLNPEWDQRDYFILSKGHASFAQYVTLAHREFFSKDLLKTAGFKDTILGGHPDRDKVPGIDVSTGSLGHGLSIAAGISIAAKHDKRPNRVFTLIGDGECQEGSIWEAAMFAAEHKLDNMIAIIDCNSLQAIGKISEVLSIEPIVQKWESFGWSCLEVDGHDCNELISAFSKIPYKKNYPTAIIARTTKGKGVSYMENEIMWHARCVTNKEYDQAIIDINSYKT